MKKLFAALSMFAGLAGCNPIDAAIDCHAICVRYQSCFDMNYDLAACESRCRSNSTTDADYRHKADQCSACINDRSCASSTFNCAAECSTVVP
jgi:hypothetical protein